MIGISRGRGPVVMDWVKIKDMGLKDYHLKALEAIRDKSVQNQRD